MAIAVVQGVITLPGYSDIPLRLKWPNDIYLGSELKIGGVVVEATTLGPQVIVNIGECYVDFEFVVGVCVYVYR